MPESAASKPVRAARRGARPGPRAARPEERAAGTEVRAAGTEERAARTVERLLDTAERLFAERGIAAVSLREIVLGSGQRNPSAAHYHFGSRDALVGAVVTRRIALINATRHVALDALDAAGTAGDVRAILAASVGALASHVAHSPWGGAYAQITAEMALHPEIAAQARVDPQAMSSLARTNAMLRAALPGVPAALVRRRGLACNAITVTTVARWLRLHGPVSSANASAFWAEVGALCDLLAPGFGAAVGASGAPGQYREPARPGAA